MITKLQALAQKIVNFHKEVHSELHEISEPLKTTIDRGFLADTAFFMREMNSHIEEIGKGLRRTKELAEKMACYVTAKMGEDLDPTIRTDYCTATPHVKMAVSIPHHKKDPEGYAELMEWLGVPKEHWSGEEPKVSLRWNGIIEAVSKAAEEGKPLPTSVDVNKLHPQYSLRITRRLAITEKVEYPDDDVF